MSETIPSVTPKFEKAPISFGQLVEEGFVGSDGNIKDGRLSVVVGVEQGFDSKGLNISVGHIIGDPNDEVERKMTFPGSVGYGSVISRVPGFDKPWTVNEIAAAHLRFNGSDPDDPSNSNKLESIVTMLASYAPGGEHSFEGQTLYDFLVPASSLDVNE